MSEFVKEFKVYGKSFCVQICGDVSREPKGAVAFVDLHEYRSELLMRLARLVSEKHGVLLEIQSPTISGGELAGGSSGNRMLFEIKLKRAFAEYKGERRKTDWEISQEVREAKNKLIVATKEFHQRINKLLEFVMRMKL